MRFLKSRAASFCNPDLPLSPMDWTHWSAFSWTLQRRASRPVEKRVSDGDVLLYGLFALGVQVHKLQASPRQVMRFGILPVSHPAHHNPRVNLHVSGKQERDVKQLSSLKIVKGDQKEPALGNVPSKTCVGLVL